MPPLVCHGRTCSGHPRLYLEGLKTWMPGTRRPGVTRQSLISTPEKISDAKAQLRGEAQARRDALPAATRKAAAETIAARAFPLPIRPGAIVSGFMPLKSEINPLPLMRKLAEAGATLALPVVAGRGKPLIMRAWRWGEPLVSGVWGIREPPADAAAVEPDILLVP